MGLRALVIAVGCALVAWSSPASADDLVVEYHVGPRSPDALGVVAAIRKIFVRKLHLTWSQKAMGDKIQYWPEPGVRDRNITASDVFDKIELGKRESVRPLPNGQINFRGGEAALSEALDTARANAALVVVHPNGRATLTRASLALAISRIRLGDQPGADVVLADLARAMGGAPLTGQGMEIEKHYNRVTAGLAKLPRGKLVVVTNDPDALIFVNEVGVGRGGSFSADMIPGPYRVVVISRGESFRYDAVVESEQERKLDLDWEVERGLRLGDEGIELELATRPTPIRLLDIARRFRDRTRSANAPGGHRVILVSVSKSCDRVLVTGTTYPDRSAKGDRLAPIAHVVFRPDDDTSIYALGDYLVNGRLTGGSDSQGVTLRDTPPSCAEPNAPSSPEPPADAPPETGERSTIAGKVVVGLGTAAFLGGLAWNHVAEPRTDSTAATIDDPNERALVLGSAGAVLVGGGVALWLRASRHSWATAGLVGLGVAATLAGAAWIGADEDNGVSSPASINDTARTGFVLGGVGLGAIVTGALLHSSEPREPRRWMRWTGIAAIGAGAFASGLALNYAHERTAAAADLDITCAQTCTPEQFRSLDDRQTSARRNSLIAGASGGAAFVGGLVLVILSRSGSRDEAAPLAFSSTERGMFVHVMGSF